MSKAAKQSIIILIVLLVGCLGFAGYSMLDAQKAKEESARLGQQLNQSQDKEKKNLGEIKNLKDEVSRAAAERDKLNEKVAKAEKTAEELYGQITEISQDRDKWKSEIDQISKERDNLINKAKDLQDQLAKKEQEKTPAAPAVAVMPSPSFTSENVPDATNNDEYWASVLKDKASLEVKIDQLNQELAKKTTDIVDLKQSNADFKIKLDSLMHDKDELDRDIKYKSDMVNNLSLELARTKNDKKFVADRVAKLNADNATLRQQINQLVTTKGALEKSILRLTQDRNEMQRKLGQTETIVQSKINEIWDIKDSLDQNMQTAKTDATPKQGEVELTPIVVNTDANAVAFNAGMSTPGFDGKVVNLNKDNNFVVVNVGESQGLRVGNTLNVYRNNKYIGRLEVIQVRKDIAAADIKDQWTEIKAGDLVK